MEENFFNLNSITDVKIENHPVVKNYEKLYYNFSKRDNSYLLSINIGEERLNSSEIKALLKYNQENDFLSENDKNLLIYILHKIGVAQTFYKISGDIQIIIEYLKNCKFPFYIEDEPTHINEENLPLDIKIYLEEESNITIELETRGEFIFGIEKCYLLNENQIFPLDNSTPVSFYREISNGKNKLTIESFQKFKEEILPTLEQNHNVSLSEDVEELTSSKGKEITAPAVVEIGKNQSSISVGLKYKIGDELFPVDNYVYEEVKHWMGKEKSIKTVKEDDELVEYVANDSLSSQDFEKYFRNERIFPKKSKTHPFQLSIPLFYYERLIERVIPKLEEKYEVIYEEGEALQLSKEKIKFKVNTKLDEKIDLLEFSVKFTIAGEQFEISELKKLFEQNKRYIYLSDGRTVYVENLEEINKWIEFLGKFEFERNKNKFKADTKGALQLEQFTSRFETSYLEKNEEFKKVIEESKGQVPVKKISLPQHIEEILRPYQKEGIYWLAFLKKHGFGGILADEMGLGKTLQTLTSLSIYPGPHLVVCPKSLIYNWESEIKKYFPDTKVLVIDQPGEKRKKIIPQAKNYDIVISSYSMVQKDYEEYTENSLKFNYIVLDEAHYVKNLQTRTSQSVSMLECETRILLTGTPLENNLEELYGTMHLVMPGYLGSRTEFRREFISKIERGNTTAMEILQSKIRPFILRRTKKEVLKELPEKQEQIVYNEMTNQQVAIYKEILERVKKEIEELVEKKGFEKSRLQILSALLKLRQVCNHPSLIDEEFSESPNMSGKYNQFLELLEETIESGEKVLVFSQFTSMLDIFEKDLKEKEIDYLRLDGNTKNRSEIVDKFNNDPEKRVMIISLKAGGVGLNLTGANAVFLYDPWWNPMAEQQAIDRAHRIGQEKTVNIYKFITKNSIEEKILKLQERKGSLFENIVSENEDFIKNLSWDDLMELFD